MMNLLLDTHVWLWSMLDRGRLSARVIRELESQENELWLSPITLWEVFTLCRKGRLTLQPSPADWVQNALTTIPLRAAHLTFEVAQETERFQLTHRDPADKFLVATARIFNLTLVTADTNLISSRTVPVLTNR